METQATPSIWRSVPNQGYRTDIKTLIGRLIMNRRIRRWLIATITTVTTGILIWMPTIAQAGLTATAVD